jgi:hypothetical protein
MLLLCVQVWLQDLGCAWSLLAPSFTNYLRMAAVHLGIRGWQLAYAQCGLAPPTQQLMRALCPERLLYDLKSATAGASSNGTV